LARILVRERELAFLVRERELAMHSQIVFSFKLEQRAPEQQLFDC